MKTDLSVIILSYNTSELTKRCTSSLLKNLRNIPKLTFEIIIVDNASKDGSVKMLKELKNSNSEIQLILKNSNLGFAKANNIALKIAKGRYILYFNSDVISENVNYGELISYLDKYDDKAGLTVNLMLSNGKIDPASHRGFPTVWNSFCYMSGLEKLTRNVPFINKYLGGYHRVELNLSDEHEIDSPSGAFFLIKKKILDRLKGFDESFFFYGEDIDLAYRINMLGYKIIYYPKYNVLHLKSSSGLKKKDSKMRNVTRDYFYDAMKIFYRKHYEKFYPGFFNRLIYYSIDYLKNHA